MQRMARCWSLLVGSRHFGRTGRFTRTDDLRLQHITAAYFPAGYTILNASGGWYDPTKKRFIREDSRQVLVCTDDRRAVKRWARELGHALQQQELLLVEGGRATTLSPTGLKRRTRAFVARK